MGMVLSSVRQDAGVRIELLDLLSRRSEAIDPIPVLESYFGRADSDLPDRLRQDLLLLVGLGQKIDINPIFSGVSR